MPADHAWETKTGDAPGIGDYTYTQCSACGASARHQHFDTDRPIIGAFLAGEGLELSLDCAVAKAQIFEYKITPKDIGGVEDSNGNDVPVEYGGTLDPRFLRINGSLILNRRGIQQLISALKQATRYVKR